MLNGEKIRKSLVAAITSLSLLTPAVYAQQLTATIQPFAEYAFPDLVNFDSMAYNTISGSIDDLRAQVETCISTFDVYACAEEMADLGAAFFSLESFDEALEQFSLAKQGYRVENGLNSKQQLPIIDWMIRTHQARGFPDDTLAINELQEQRYALAMDTLEITDPRRLDALIQYNEWSNTRYLQISGTWSTQPEMLLEKNDMLYDRSVEFIDDQPFPIAIKIQGLQQLIEVVQPVVMHFAKYRNDDSRFMLFNNRLSTLKKLEEYYMQNEEPELAAKAMVFQADMYLLVVRGSSKAFALYKKANEKLIELGAQDLQYELFGSVTPIPSDIERSSSKEFLECLKNAEFSVSKYGDAKNVYVPDGVVCDPELEEKIKWGRFRPSLSTISSQ